MALDASELRALRRKARLATLDALEALGGCAHRHAIRDRAIEHGGFTERERTAPAPPTKTAQYKTRLEYELSWTLTNLKRDGLVVNPERSAWALTEVADVRDEPLAAPVVMGRLEQLRSMPYREFLRTPEWRETRGAALVRAGHACSLDLTHVDGLEVHHRTYVRLGEERPEDVVVLCRECHRLHHRHAGRPRRAERRASVPPPALSRPDAIYVPKEWSSPEPRSLLRRLLDR